MLQFTGCVNEAQSPFNHQLAGVLFVGEIFTIKIQDND